MSDWWEMDGETPTYLHVHLLACLSEVEGR